MIVDGVAKISSRPARTCNEGLIVGGVVILAVAFTQTGQGGDGGNGFFAERSDGRCS